MKDETIDLQNVRDVLNDFAFILHYTIRKLFNFCKMLLGQYLLTDLNFSVIMF